MSRVYHFSISIDRDEYLKYYAGAASVVRTQTHEGLVIEFPANALMRFVSHSGISGTFAIHLKADNKLDHIERVN